MINNSDQTTVLITTGPTREPIDPVRYITNHSSGKMGYAIAEAFLDSGYQVVLVSGPVEISLSHENLTLMMVNTAIEMYDVCRDQFTSVKAAVFCGDYDE